MTTPEMRTIRLYVTSAYDLQKLRIQVGGRISANFRSKLMKMEIDEEGVKRENEEAVVKGELPEEAEKLIDRLRKSYQRLTDGMARNRTLPKKEGFVGDELITEYTELILIFQYFQLESQEKTQFRLITDLLNGIPIYEEWLFDQKGIGPAFAGILLSYFDIHISEYVSSFWSYCGIDVAPDGYARSKRREHLIERQYINKKGEEATRLSTTFNPWLQAKLIGAVAPSMMRASSPYRESYDNYKLRINADPTRMKCSVSLAKELMENAKNEEEYEELRRKIWTPGRTHKGAIRYMLKIFIKDFWLEWRKIEGLPITLDWWENLRGYPHGGIHGSIDPDED